MFKNSQISNFSFVTFDFSGGLWKSRKKFTLYTLINYMVKCHTFSFSFDNQLMFHTCLHLDTISLFYLIKFSNFFFFATIPNIWSLVFYLFFLLQNSNEFQGRVFCCSLFFNFITYVPYILRQGCAF